MDDRRAGRAPVTNHDPWDALNADDPRNQDDGDDADDEAQRRARDLRPLEADPTSAAACSALEALAWLRVRAAWNPVTCNNGV